MQSEERAGADAGAAVAQQGTPIAEWIVATLSGPLRGQSAVDIAALEGELAGRLRKAEAAGAGLIDHAALQAAVEAARLVVRGYRITLEGRDVIGAAARMQFAQTAEKVLASQIEQDRREAANPRPMQGPSLLGCSQTLILSELVAGVGDCLVPREFLARFEGRLDGVPGWGEAFALYFAARIKADAALRRELFGGGLVSLAVAGITEAAHCDRLYRMASAIAQSFVASESPAGPDDDELLPSGSQTIAERVPDLLQGIAAGLAVEARLPARGLRRLVLQLDTARGRAADLEDRVMALGRSYGRLRAELGEVAEGADDALRAQALRALDVGACEDVATLLKGARSLRLRLCGAKALVVAGKHREAAALYFAMAEEAGSDGAPRKAVAIREGLAALAETVRAGGDRAMLQSVTGLILERQPGADGGSRDREAVELAALRASLVLAEHAGEAEAAQLRAKCLARARAIAGRADQTRPADLVAEAHELIGDVLAAMTSGHRTKIRREAAEAYGLALAALGDGGGERALLIESKQADSLSEAAYGPQAAETAKLAEASYRRTVELTPRTLRPLRWASQRAALAKMLLRPQRAATEKLLEDALAAASDARHIFAQGELPLDLAGALAAEADALIQLARDKRTESYLTRAVESFEQAVLLLVGCGAMEEAAGIRLRLSEALRRLGERTSRTELLAAAADAARKAAQAYEGKPGTDNWSLAFIRLSGALLAQASLRKDGAFLEEARTVTASALSRTPKDKQLPNWSALQQLAGEIAMALGKLTGDAAWYQEAVGTLEGAMPAVDTAAMRRRWLMMAAKLGEALFALGMMAGDRQALDRARKVVERALEAAKPGGHEGQVAQLRNLLTLWNAAEERAPQRQQQRGAA